MNGVLDIDATVVTTGKTSTFTIESAPGRLSKAQLEQARLRLKQLKFHPREALPNVTALARADALYVELTGDARTFLGSAIVCLRAAMEHQDPAGIRSARESLLRVTEELDPRR